MRGVQWRKKSGRVDLLPVHEGFIMSYFSSHDFSGKKHPEPGRGGRHRALALFNLRREAGREALAGAAARKGLDLGGKKTVSGEGFAFKQKWLGIFLECDWCGLYFFTDVFLDVNVFGAFSLLFIVLFVCFLGVAWILWELPPLEFPRSDLIVGEAYRRMASR